MARKTSILRCYDGNYADQSTRPLAPELVQFVEAMADAAALRDHRAALRLREKARR